MRNISPVANHDTLTAFSGPDAASAASVARGNLLSLIDECPVRQAASLDSSRVAAAENRTAGANFPSANEIDPPKEMKNGLCSAIGRRETGPVLSTLSRNERIAFGPAGRPAGRPLPAEQSSFRRRHNMFPRKGGAGDERDRGG